MTIRTPLRVLDAVKSPAGRRKYRRALRERAWRALSSLPFSLTFNASLADSLRIQLFSRDQVISRSIFVSGEWEPAESAFIRSYVKPGMIAFDVGANIGAHTLALATRVGPQGSVHAFEPTLVFDTLSHNVCQNGFDGRVSLNHCAVGAEDGTLRLLSCKPGYELFTSRGAPLVPEALAGEHIDYPMISLDSYARSRGIKTIDFLKVDVEGSETLVFNGSSELLASQSLRCIMFEFNGACMANSGDSPSELLRPVRSAGYHLAMLDDLCKFKPIPDSMTGMFTIIATPAPMQG
jgi:FkbM family methyltransferase